MYQDGYRDQMKAKAQIQEKEKEIQKVTDKYEMQNKVFADMS